MYTDGSVTKDQSGSGFTVKPGATTIHEDSTAYTVSTSSLTMEVATESPTRALHWTASRGGTSIVKLKDETVYGGKSPQNNDRFLHW